MKKPLVIFLFGLLFLVGLILGGRFAWQHQAQQVPETSGQETPIEELAESLTPTQTFIMVGDTGSGLPGQQQVADAIERFCQERRTCQSVFILGDVIYEKGVKTADDPLFQSRFEVPYQDINLPFYIGLGNHDYGGCVECYLEYAAHSDKWKMPARYYTVAAGVDASVFVIDTEHFTEEQETWLREQLATSQTTWKIIAGHRPVLSYETSKYGENWNGRDELKELACTTADLYVAGHAHTMEDNGPLEDCSVIQLVSGAGGASIRTLEDSEQRRFGDTQHGFLAVTVQGNTLQYEFVDINGATLYQQELRK